MSTILGNLLTILGVIIGFVWIGIGTELGKETYNILLKESATRILTKFKERRAKKIINKLIDETKTIIRPRNEEKQQNVYTDKPRNDNGQN